CASGVPLMW
nr:immunoglobulin heavy chain junction region [Macaca mulatta]MOV50220.1 immunoglobulin heavy chain junction region [Macaca mulatta]MOV51058.1 immunoglobulin heavy chain junction region [Macaca mulatta]MOV52979.1 immunoglobulin heavy chain junction region [Macaca mulatta]MOV53148.1 immunoglobulin heavy chain junction region [Macaca mulatta]